MEQKKHIYLQVLPWMSHPIVSLFIYSSYKLIQLKADEMKFHKPLLNLFYYILPNNMWI